MLKQKNWIVILCIALIFLTIVGCMQQDQDQIITPKKPRAIKYPVKVKDQSGELIEIPDEPERIVSLVPNATEIAYALGLKDQIVAVTTNDDYPPEVKKLPKVGDININIEQVVAQKPDLVLASTANNQETIKKLRDLNIPVLVTDGKDTKQIYRAISNISLATNRAFEAEQLIAKMNKQIRETYGKVVQIPKEKRVKVWVELDSELYTVGGDDFLNQIITYAGGVNVAEKEKGWPKISPEQVVKWQPDVIISVYGGEQEILKRKGWETIPAIKNKRVYSIDPNLVSRPGPRITEGIETLAQRFYPERFGDAPNE